MKQMKLGRFLLKNYLSFEEIELNFDNQNSKQNLVLFTGPSGAGKSILLKAIISCFGMVKDIKASYSEIEILNNNLIMENFELKGEEDFIIKYIKNNNIKFFIDDKSISKKNLEDFSHTFIKHLHLKDTSEFESKNIIKALDNIAIKTYPSHLENLGKYNTLFEEYRNIKNNLKKLEEEEKNIENLKEFLAFEIDKIEKTNPKIGEYEELQSIKKRLSDKETIEKEISKISDLSNKISFLYKIIENTNTSDSPEDIEKQKNNIEIYDSFSNLINSLIDTKQESLQGLDDINIEAVLDRISEINALNKKYGSIENCLETLEEKKKKLEEYNNVSFQKSNLFKREKELNLLLKEVAILISEARKNCSLSLKEKINEYLNLLHLEGANIIFKNIDYNLEGIDDISFELNHVNLETISSGEFNRLRLALLTARTDFDLESNGILFLDEIDANLSGKESESIAKVVTKLSQSYQVFAISHQPQLTSKADLHFLVEKKEGKSSVRLLNQNEREIEISRMISGENVTEEAKTFAKNLLKNK